MHKRIRSFRYLFCRNEEGVEPVMAWLKTEDGGSYSDVMVRVMPPKQPGGMRQYGIEEAGLVVEPLDGFCLEHGVKVVMLVAG